MDKRKSKFGFRFAIVISPMFQARTRVSRGAICSSCLRILLFFQLVPLVINQFRQNTVELLWRNETELTVAEWSGLLSIGIRDERVAFRLQLLYGLSGVVHVEAEEHNSFPTFLDEFCHVALGRCRFHEFETDLTDPVACHSDLLGFIDVLVVRASFSQKRFPDLTGLVEVLYSDADMVNLIHFHFTSHPFLESVRPGALLRSVEN